MSQDFISSTTSVGHWYSTNTSGYLGTYDFNLLLMWKGMDQDFENADRFLKTIDLSSNHLTGEIPIEMEYLFGLIH